MKKIYSLVLMAVILLVGTNAWARNFSGNAAELQKAIADIIYGEVSDPEIKLQNNVELNGTTIWVGTQNLDPASYKSITLDLNGHSITSNSATSTNRTLIALTHGELKIINTAANEATLGLTGYAKDGATIVSVYGSYKSSRWNEEGTALVGEGTNTRVEGWCSHLEIGSNVKLYAEDGCQGTGLYVGPGNLKYPKADGTLAATAYPGWVMKGNIYSFAHGIRVDFYGKIDFQGTNSGKAYGIKANGTLRSPLSWANEGKNEPFQTKYTTSTEPTYIPYLANYTNYNEDINTNATLATDATHKRDTVDAPFIWVHPGAEINVRDAGSKVTALYAAGYAKWLVQGYAEGKTGMYVSAGVMDLNDAYVKSTAAEWQSSTNAGSANGGGSGVVINSRDSYAGGVEFTVSGDTHIESIEGYAIEEIVNTTPVPNPKADPSNPEYDSEAPATIQVTKVADITIEGGTITGGDEGAIVVSTATLEEAADPNNNVEVVIYGGNVIGDSYAGDKGAVTTGDLSDLMPNTGYHTTEVTDENGKTIIVVSKGDEPDAGDLLTGNMVSNQADSASIKWTVNTKDTIQTGQHLILKELEINTNGLAQELVIKENATLEVGRVVLGKDAKIIVEAGGKFIVYGKQGIVAPVADNIVLKASETAQATFLFNPAVTSNRHPNAKVEYHSNSFYSDHNVQQFFGLPTYNGTVTNIETTSDAKIYFDLWRNPNWDYIGAINVPGDPSVLANLNKFNLPFGLVCITSKNDAAHKPVFTFSGELTGNMDHTFTLQQGWTSMANAYTGSIAGSAIISQLAKWNASYGTEQNVYVYTLNPATGNIQWSARNKYVLTSGGLNAMAPIMFHNGSKVEGVVLDYSDLVWNPLFPAQNLAPAHREISNITKAQINIAGENETDNTTIVADSELGDDKSFCAPKYDNAGLQLYVMGNEKFDIYAADEIENSYIGYRTVNAGMYTISFEDVQGEDLVLVDLVNGNRTNIAEGAIYTFSADANESNDYRFEIVAAAKVPTAIENTEAVKSAKGIYTITGQYVGEMNVWNALPAGVYVVNGEKKVK